MDSPLVLDFPASPSSGGVAGGPIHTIPHAVAASATAADATQGTDTIARTPAAGASLLARSALEADANDVVPLDDDNDDAAANAAHIAALGAGPGQGPMAGASPLAAAQLDELPAPSPDRDALTDELACFGGDSAAAAPPAVETASSLDHDGSTSLFATAATTAADVLGEGEGEEEAGGSGQFGMATSPAAGILSPRRKEIMSTIWQYNSGVKEKRRPSGGGTAAPPPPQPRAASSTGSPCEGSATDPAAPSLISATADASAVLSNHESAPTSAPANAPSPSIITIIISSDEEDEEAGSDDSRPPTPVPATRVMPARGRVGPVAPAGVGTGSSASSSSAAATATATTTAATTAASKDGSRLASSFPPRLPINKAAIMAHRRFAGGGGGGVGAATSTVDKTAAAVAAASTAEPTTAVEMPLGSSPGRSALAEASDGVAASTMHSGLLDVRDATMPAQLSTSTTVAASAASHRAEDLKAFIGGAREDAATAASLDAVASSVLHGGGGSSVSGISAEPGTAATATTASPAAAASAAGTSIRVAAAPTAAPASGPASSATRAPASPAAAAAANDEHEHEWDGPPTWGELDALRSRAVLAWDPARNPLTRCAPFLLVRASETRGRVVHSVVDAKMLRFVDASGAPSGVLCLRVMYKLADSQRAQLYYSNWTLLDAFDPQWQPPDALPHIKGNHSVVMATVVELAAQGCEKCAKTAASTALASASTSASASTATITRGRCPLHYLAQLPPPPPPSPPLASASASAAPSGSRCGITAAPSAPANGILGASRAVSGLSFFVERGGLPGDEDDERDGGGSSSISSSRGSSGMGAGGRPLSPLVTTTPGGKPLALAVRVPPNRWGTMMCTTPAEGNPFARVFLRGIADAAGLEDMGKRDLQHLLLDGYGLQPAPPPASVVRAMADATAAVARLVEQPRGGGGGVRGAGLGRRGAG